MNLIEQLGGYDRAKKLVDDCKRYGRSDVKVPVNGGFIHIVADFLELDLLEYRRQHNIFEVGDKVVVRAEPFWPEDYMIQTLEQEHIGRWYMSAWRHATDAEIEAGRGL